MRNPNPKVSLGTARSIVALACGQGHTLALDDVGTVWATGMACASGLLEHRNGFAPVPQPQAPTIPNLTVVI